MTGAKGDNFGEGQVPIFAKNGKSKKKRQAHRKTARLSKENDNDM